MLKPLVTSGLNINGSLPIQATQLAKSWDLLYWAIFAISIFFFVLVMAAMVWFAIKYRDRPGAKAKYIEHHIPLEIVWTVVPTILVLAIFAWGWVLYEKMISPPSDAYEIRVVGKQWLWQFMYADGRSMTNEVYVPVRKPVKFVMTSTDVLHSFFIPDFRVKQDVVPGMYTSVWFEATVPGDHIVFCAEYCGTAHSGMLAKVIALEEKDWNDFVKGKEMKLASATTGGTLIEKGEKLTQLKGCVACHSADGSARIGPTYKGLLGREREFADGSKVVADENYIRESIEQPEKHKVKGFEQLVMPSFSGQLNEEEFGALIAYIKQLK